MVRRAQFGSSPNNPNEESWTRSIRNPETRSTLQPNEDFRSAISISQRTPEPTITWIFDDARDDNYTNGHPVFVDKNAEYGVAIPTQKVGTSGHLTWGQIEVMSRDDGLMEPVGHGYNELQLGSATEDEVVEEIYKSMSDFLDHGYRPLTHAYVGGSQDDYSQGVTSELFPFAWGVRNQRIDENMAQPHFLPRVSTDNGVAESTLKSEIDSAVSNNNGIVLYGHSIIDGQTADENSLETSTGKIRNIIDYARNNGMTWVSPTELIKRSFVPMQWGGPNAPTINQSTNGYTKVLLRGGRFEFQAQGPADGGQVPFVVTESALDVEDGVINLKGNDLFGDGAALARIRNGWKSPMRSSDPDSSELGTNDGGMYISDGSAGVTGDEGDLIYAFNTGSGIVTGIVADRSADLS